MKDWKEVTKLQDELQCSLMSCIRAVDLYPNDIEKQKTYIKCVYKNDWGNRNVEWETYTNLFRKRK